MLKFLNRTSFPKDYVNFLFSHSVIFIHVPKNSGTSIARALDLQTSTHITATEIKKIIGRRSYKKAFKFAVVRDPMSRFASLYNYARMENSFYHSSIKPQEALYGKHSDYDLLKSASLEECANYLLEGRLQHDKNWNHWNPQAFWVSSKEKIIVDFLMRFENLYDDFEKLKRIISSPSIELPVVNKSNISETSKVEITKRTQEIVYEYYDIDYRLFEYTKQKSS